MKHLLIALILLFLSASVGAQIHRKIPELKPFYPQLDALSDQLELNHKAYLKNYQPLIEQAKKNKNEDLLAILYFFHGSYFYQLHEVDSSKVYLNLSMKWAEKGEQKSIYLASKVRKIFCDDNEKSPLEQFRLINDAFNESKKEQDTLNMIYSLNGMSLYAERFDSLKLSVKKLYEALSLANSSNNNYEKAFILNNLSLKKISLGIPDSALVDLRNAEKITKSLDNTRLMCYVLQNTGIYHLITENIDSAAYYFDTVYTIAKANQYAYVIISTRTNGAYIHRLRGNLQQSLNQYMESVSYAKKHNFLHALPQIYLGITNVLMDKGEYKKAHIYADSSLLYTEHTNGAELRQLYYKVKSEICSKEKNYEKALEYTNYYYAIKDSLKDDSNFKLLAELQFRFRDQEKEKLQLAEQTAMKLQLKEQEINMERTNFIIAIITALFILIISFILIRYLRLKQRGEISYSIRLLRQIEEERNRIAQDLHDGIGQNVVVLKNKFNRLGKDDTITESEIDQNFSETIQQIRTISRSILPPELKRLNLRKSLENLMLEVEKSTGIAVFMDIDCLDKIEFSKHQMVQIYRIIQELVTNTIKHSEAKSLKLDANFDPSDGISFIYQDNGKGLNSDDWVSINNSVGFRSIRQRLNDLGGSIKNEKQKKGVKFLIKIASIR